MSDEPISYDERAEAFSFMVQCAAEEAAAEFTRKYEGAYKEFAEKGFIAGYMHAKGESLVPSQKEELAGKIIGMMARVNKELTVPGTQFQDWFTRSGLDLLCSIMDASGRLAKLTLETR